MHPNDMPLHPPAHPACRPCSMGPLLRAASVFDMFLGPQPLDEHGKQDVGHGMVWAANGFRCESSGAVLGMHRPWHVVHA